jgi:hypothetical protein
MTELEKALFSQQIEAVVVSIYSNERPLHGLAGILDWRLQGAISRPLKAGYFSGAEGECIYLPVTRHHITYHLLLIGGGITPSPGIRPPLAKKSIEILNRNLNHLRLKRMGASHADLGHPTSKTLELQLEGVSLWIMH